MLNRQSFLDWSPTQSRVAIALALSLLLHLIFLGFIHIDLSALKPTKDVVDVRFAHLVKSPPPDAATAEKHDPEPETLPPEPPEEVKKPEPQILEPQPEIPTVPSVVAEPEPGLQELPVNVSEEIMPAQAGEEIQTEPETDLTERFPTEAAAPPLSAVETDFDILRGLDGYKVGQTKVSYKARGDGTYYLNSESEAKGFASLFLSGKLIQRSEGLITETGLKPQEFLYQYGKSGKKQHATFDWDKRKLTLETDKGTQATRLPKDTQDLMSFMYQFMFVPPLEEMQLNITNGKRLKAYAYSFVGEVELSTKMGTVRAMHLENTNDDGDEKNEIWLAVDYRFLPVKIRKTEKDGSVIEQVVTSIKTDILQ